MPKGTAGKKELKFEPRIQVPQTEVLKFTLCYSKLCLCTALSFQNLSKIFINVLILYPISQNL